MVGKRVQISDQPRGTTPPTPQRERHVEPVRSPTSMPEDPVFSHDLHHRRRLGQLAGQPLVLGPQPSGIILAARGSAMRPSRRRRAPGHRVPRARPLPDLGLVQALTTQRRSLAAVRGRLVLRDHLGPVGRGERSTQQPTNPCVNRLQSMRPRLLMPYSSGKPTDNYSLEKERLVEGTPRDSRRAGCDASSRANT